MPTLTAPLAVTVDCHDPARLAEFRRTLVDGDLESEPHDDDYIVVEIVSGFGFVGFQQVPEDKVVKNRVQLDSDVADTEAAVEVSTASGAVKVGVPVQESGNWFQVMCDPEGNEFSLFRRKETVDP
ncbi:MAG: VOC family protein [Actinobacteria bacterium]|nr:VOC family protein [Actinomycetota bacterium]